MHMIWFSAILPLAGFIVWVYPATRIKRIWSLCFAVAVLGLISVVGFDLYFFLKGGGVWKDCGMRALFSIMTSTDIPFFQLLVASVMNWVLSGRFSKVSNESAIGPVAFGHE